MDDQIDALREALRKIVARTTDPDALLCAMGALEMTRKEAQMRREARFGMPYSAS